MQIQVNRALAEDYFQPWINTLGSSANLLQQDGLCGIDSK